ncbi:hypothetical protein E2C01_015769 [Portunus trituberculatus]|uniref:Uncharacterized protein n=1 Tax=Portunus trituberculatus TaxID=210409 RepID=A0A5B7DMT0_PORTR|nr:hypothetical protein [Portunus trituberculatus]
MVKGEAKESCQNHIGLQVAEEVKFEANLLRFTCWCSSAITSSVEVSYAHFDVIYCRDRYHGKSVIEPLHSVHK